jgi:hypothetical protein
MYHEEVPYIFDDGEEWSLHFLPPEVAEANRAADAAIAEMYYILLKGILSGEIPSILSEGKTKEPPPP